MAVKIKGTLQGLHLVFTSIKISSVSQMLWLFIKHVAEFDQSVLKCLGKLTKLRGINAHKFTKFNGSNN